MRLRQIRTGSKLCQKKWMQHHKDSKPTLLLYDKLQVFFFTHDKLLVKLKKCAPIVKLNINTEAVKDSDISYLSVHMGERNNLFEKLLLNFAITLLFFILTILTNKSSNLIYIITQVNQSKMLKKNVTAAKITKTLHWYAAYFNTAMTNQNHREKNS
jgi:hypothetical protein